MSPTFPSPCANTQPRRRYRTNTTGHPNVVRAGDGYDIRLKVIGRDIYVGRRLTLDDGAALARAAAERRQALYDLHIDRPTLERTSYRVIQQILRGELTLP